MRIGLRTLVVHVSMLILVMWSTILAALELTPEEQAWIANHPVIRVGVDPAWPPYEFMDEQGKHQGMSADYLALLSQKIGVKFQIAPAQPWSDTQQQLEQKQLDFTPSIVSTPKRDQFLNFSQPYISFPVVILTRSDEAFIGQLEDLSGKRVGVEADYYADEILQQNYPTIQRVRYPYLRDLLSALALGQVDYVLTNYASASYAVQQLHMTGLKLAAVTQYQSPLSMGVRKDWPEFVSILNKALNELTPEQHQRIRQHWLGIKKENIYIRDIWRLHPDIILLLLMILMFVVLLAIVFYFRHRLMTRKLLAEKAQQELAESEKRFRLLIENAPIAFAIFKGKVGIIKMLNRTFINMFGYQPSELHDVEDWWRVAYPNPSYREQIQKIWYERLELARKSHQVLEPMEATVLCRDGSERYIRFHAILIGSLSLVAFIDLTDQKKYQTALLTAKENAEQATQAKSLFLANMSHEIRTPMNGILGLTALLEKTELNERQHDYVTKIYSSGEFLLGLLNDILDLSKVEAGKLELEKQPFTIAQLLEPLRALALSATQHKPVEVLFYVSPDVPKVLLGDLLRLGQILTNLLGNAIKFSAKGEIEIGVATITNKNHQQRLHLWVRDTGIGMTTEQAAKIFEAFSQADASTTRKYGGTGLGLTICKRLIELMNGEIKVQSKVNQGSRFDVFIDLIEAPQDSSSLESINIPKLNLLLIDNNHHSALAIRSIAERLQWEVDIFERLDESLTIETSHYDFVLLDADFADEHSVQYLPKALPKILLQTPLQESDPLLGTMIDFKHCFTKPITEEVLLGLVPSAIPKAKFIEEKPFLARRILLVEDNTINQLVGVRLLESLGAEVDVAENGYVALSLLQQVGNFYDVVLMDLQMPVMDGLETTRQLRLIEQFTDLPVIAMTANVMATDREACFEAGMNDFMSKPIRIQELREKIYQWLK